MRTLQFIPPDRRRHPRTQLRMMLHGIRLDPDGGDVRDTLHMLDISRSGMGAMADRWLQPGQRIVLCLPLHPDGGRRNMYATVVRCQRAQDSFHLGLEFDRSGIMDAQCYPSVAAAAA